MQRLKVKVVKILAALTILNSSSDTKKVAALVARAGLVALVRGLLTLGVCAPVRFPEQ